MISPRPRARIPITDATRQAAHDDTSGRRRSWRRTSLAIGLVVAMAGCGGLQDQTRDLAADSRSEAIGRVGDAVVPRLEQAREQFGGRVDVNRVCALVADDRLTGAERGRLEVAVELGEALGLPADLTTAGRTVLDATDGATDRVDGLVEACRTAGADLQPDG